MISAKLDEIRAYTMVLEDRELLTIQQFLLNINFGEELVYLVLSWDKDGDRDDNGIDDGDRDDANFSNSRDNANTALC